MKTEDCLITEMLDALGELLLMLLPWVCAGIAIVLPLVLLMRHLARRREFRQELARMREEGRQERLDYYRKGGC